jgi:hypothetical protein
MNLFRKTLILLGCAAALGCGNMIVMAQDEAGPGGGGPPMGPRRNFDPQAMMDRLRERLDVRDDAKWAVISEKIVSVLDARRAAVGRFGGGPRRGPGPGAPWGPVPPLAPGDVRDDSFGPQMRANSALHAAVNHNSSDASIKAALSEVRALHNNREQAYAKAQDDLRASLDPRQEAQLTLAGILR